MTYRTPVREHARRTRRGRTTVHHHLRSVHGAQMKDIGTTIIPAGYTDGIQIVNENPKDGGLFAKKMLGKNLMLRVYKFGDDYKVFAYRRDNDKGRDSWTESSATSFPQRREKVLQNLREYKTVGDVTTLHPVLRDAGTSMSRGYNYKIRG